MLSCCCCCHVSCCTLQVAALVSTQPGQAIPDPTSPQDPTTAEDADHEEFQDCIPDESEDNEQEESFQDCMEVAEEHLQPQLLLLNVDLTVDARLQQHQSQAQHHGGVKVERAADALVQRQQRQARLQLLLRRLASRRAANLKCCYKRQGRKLRAAQSRSQQLAAELAEQQVSAAKLESKIAGMQEQQREDMQDISDHNATIAQQQQQLSDQASLINQLQQQLSDTQTALAEGQAAAAEDYAALESHCNGLQQTVDQLMADKQQVGCRQCLLAAAEVALPTLAVHLSSGHCCCCSCMWRCHSASRRPAPVMERVLFGYFCHRWCWGVVNAAPAVHHAPYDY